MTKTQSSHNQSSNLSFDEFREYAFIASEQKKEDYESSFSNAPTSSNIRFEYMEKVIIYGYIMVSFLEVFFI
jgi:hypothetical protein